MINFLELKGYEVYPTVEKCGRAIILGGRHENPTSFNCEKVLIHVGIEWDSRWDFFKPILEEYYDKMIDITGMSLPKAAQTIIEQCN